MASDFSVAWQCLSKRTIGFSLRIKLHALIWLGVSPPNPFLLFKSLHSQGWTSTQRAISDPHQLVSFNYFCLCCKLLHDKIRKSGLYVHKQTSRYFASDWTVKHIKEDQLNATKQHFFAEFFDHFLNLIFLLNFLTISSISIFAEVFDHLLNFNFHWIFWPAIYSISIFWWFFDHSLNFNICLIFCWIFWPFPQFQANPDSKSRFQLYPVSCIFVGQHSLSGTIDLSQRRLWVPARVARGFN
jgi:hypothetical protein